MGKTTKSRQYVLRIPNQDADNLDLLANYFGCTKTEILVKSLRRTCKDYDLEALRKEVKRGE